MVAPKAADAGQRLFIAHGRDDRLIAVAVSRDGSPPRFLRRDEYALASFQRRS